jgi:hypothetical protein
VGNISTQSAYDSPMKLRFRGRAVMPPKMAQAIARAFVMSPQARVAQLHDFGLDLPVMFCHPDDAYPVSSQCVPKHVIVCTDRGGECVLALYPVGTHYEVLVQSGADTRELVCNVDGLETLFADADGEFAGALIDGSQLLLDDRIPDTTATWRVVYEPTYVDEALPVGNVSEVAHDDTEVLRLFQREMNNQQVEAQVEVTA